MNRRCLFMIVAHFFAYPLSGWSQEVLTMVYRPSEKLPYIAAAPANTGLYQNVFTAAARRLGLDLKILRYPKKRAYAFLEEGSADFYPGASFNPYREKIGYFINNRMAPKGTMIVHRDDIRINSVEEIRGYNLLYNLGGTPSFYYYGGVDVAANTLREVPGLNIAKGLQILAANQSDFYAYDLTAVELYLKAHPATGVRLFPVILDDHIDHLLFAKSSAYYRERPNPAYDPDKALAIDNLPYTLAEESIAYRFQQVLEEMESSGEIERRFRQLVE